MKPTSFALIWALAQFVLLLSGTGCFDTSIEEVPSESDDDGANHNDAEANSVNLPPHIDDSFLEPREDVVRVESRETVTLAVSALLDPNPEEQLYYAFIGDRSGLLVQATATAKPEDERHGDIFYYFDRAQVEVDPCSEPLRDRDDELIRLFVSDRPFQRVTTSDVEIDEDAHLVTHRWLLRFGPQLCH